MIIFRELLAAGELQIKHKMLSWRASVILVLIYNLVKQQAVTGTFGQEYQSGPL